MNGSGGLFRTALRPARPGLARLAPLLLVPILLLGATGCRQADNAPGPGGLTVGENRALDRAAAMIEGQTPPEPQPAAVPASGTAASGTPAADTAPAPTAGAPH